MRRREPPPLATWMLENLTPADRDEALAGDLLEVFRAGKTRGWYWQQALTACAVSWTESLRERLPLLVFALAWSIAAPAWKVLCDKVGYDLTDGWHGGLLTVLIGVAVWTTLNAVFLWAGIAVYGLSHRSFGQRIGRGMIGRAWLLAPLIFLPTIGATFILMALYSYPGLTNARLAATPMGQIADWRMPADVLRIPYFVALIGSLWSAIPRGVRAARLEDEAALESASVAEVTPVDAAQARRFLGFVVVAGFVNAMICGFILCKLPAMQEPDVLALAGRAALFVVVGALAGVGGSWFYWRNPSSPFREQAPLPFALFALVCAVGWVWVPAMVLFLTQLSAAGAFTAAAGALVLAASLRSGASFVFASMQEGGLSRQFEDGELFAESLYRAPVEAYGYVIAIGLYWAGVSLATQSYYTAALMLALSAFLFVWKRSAVPAERLPVADQYKRAIRRLAWMAIPATLVTMWALMDGVAHRNHAAEASAASASKNGAGTKTKSHGYGYSIDGYESVILWPTPEKKQIVPPIPRQISLLAPGTKQPVILRFTGAYWFVQPPHVHPGANAHEAHGSPLDVNIRSSNFVPLAMDAHQYLSSAIPIERCREVDVDIENSDHRAGTVSLAVLLGDGSPLHEQEEYLGQEPIQSTEPENFSEGRAPVFETLKFAVPEATKIRSFKEITVIVLSDFEHSFEAPKIAIRQFELVPR